MYETGQLFFQTSKLIYKIMSNFYLSLVIAEWKSCFSVHTFADCHRHWIHTTLHLNNKTLFYIFCLFPKLLKNFLFKGIISRDFGILFLFHWIWFIFLFFTFSYIISKKVVDRGKDPFELMILLLCRGFFAHFNLAGLNLRPGT
jgi:hypothetical protein